MLPTNFFIISISCILSFHCLAQATEQNVLRPSKKKDEKVLKSSTIYHIKKYEPPEQKPQTQKQLGLEQSRLEGEKNDIEDKLEPQQAQQHQHQQLQQHHQQQHKQHQQHRQQQQQLQQTSENIPTKPSRGKKIKTSSKNTHVLNKKLLNKLGLTKVKAPNSHNRKRLAVESRRHASPDDSHMFIIKLPPNLYYYTSPKAVQHAKNALEQNDNGKKVSFPFNSNGKPGRVYHWNLPAIKKILEDKTRFPTVATATKDQLIDIKNVPTWTKPWENETVEKSYGSSSGMALKKSLKRKSPSYYAPTHSVNKNSFNKYFPGNGKPKGFYVIKENQKKPLYYKNIVA